MNYRQLSLKEIYNLDLTELLDYLFNNCNIVHLNQENQMFDDDNLIKKLKPYITKSELVYTSEGTERLPEHTYGPFVKHIMEINSQVIKILNKYEKLLTPLSHFDITFYKDDICYFYNIAHDNLFVFNQDKTNSFLKSLDTKISDHKAIIDQFHTIANPSKKLIASITEFAQINCNYIKLVQLRESTSSQKLINSIIPAVIHSYPTSDWDGAKLGQLDQFVIEHYVKLTPQVISKLNKHKKLYTTDSDFDISYYKDDKCYFSSVSTNKLFGLNPEIMQDFIVEYESEHPKM